jgi:hypothetical protein
MEPFYAHYNVSGYETTNKVYTMNGDFAFFPSVGKELLCQKGLSVFFVGCHPGILLLSEDTVGIIIYQCIVR